MLATLGLGIVSGLAAECILTSYRRWHDPSDQAYLEKCVKRAAERTDERFDVISYAVLEGAFDEMQDVPEIETVHEQDADAMVSELADAVVDLSEIDSHDDAEEAVRWFLVDFERQLIRDPSRGLPIIINHLEQITGRVADVDAKTEACLTELRELRDRFEPDLEELEAITKENGRIEIPSGYEMPIERDVIDDVEATLDDGASVLITGVAGVGKSTLVSQVIDRWSGPRFLLSANQFSAVSASDLDTVLGLSAPLRQVLKEITDAETPVLLAIDQLDAVDGTQTGETYRNLLEWVASQDYVFGIGACRKWNIDESGMFGRLVERSSFNEIEVPELTPPVVVEALRRIGTVVDEDDSPVEMCQRPLELSLVADIVHKSEFSDISTLATRVNLWQAYLNHLERWLDTSDQPTFETVLEVASDLALESLRADGDSVQCGLDPSPPVKALQRLNILVPLRRRRDEFVFRHSQLRSYFYANKATYSGHDATDLPENLGVAAQAELLTWMLALYDDDGAHDDVDRVMESIFASGELNTYGQAVFVSELSERSPTSFRTATLQTLLEYLDAMPVLRKRFFSQIDGSWVAPLYVADAFDPLRKEHLMELFIPAYPEYLADIGMVLSEVYPMQETPRVTYYGFLENLDPDQQVPAVENLLELLESHPGWQSDTIFDLLGQLLENGEPELACNLLKQALASEWSESKRRSRYFHVWNTIQSHLVKHLEQYLTEAPEPFLDALESAIAQDYENEVGVTPLSTSSDDRPVLGLVPDPRTISPDDVASYGCNESHMDEVRYGLVATLRASLVIRWTQAPSQELRERLDRYLQYNPPFNRLSLLTIESAPEADMELVCLALTDERLLESIIPEAKPLLTASAPVLSLEKQAAVLEAFDGPLLGTFENTEARDEYLFGALAPAEQEYGPLTGPFSARLDELRDVLDAPEVNEDEDNTSEPSDGAPEARSGTTPMSDFPDVPAVLIEECLTFGGVTNPDEFIEHLTEMVREDPAPFIAASDELREVDPEILRNLLPALADGMDLDETGELLDTYLHWIHDVSSTPSEYAPSARLGALDAVVELLQTSTLGDDHRLSEAFIAALTDPHAGPSQGEEDIYTIVGGWLFIPNYEEYVRLAALSVLIDPEIEFPAIDIPLAESIEIALDDESPGTGFVVGRSLPALYHQGIGMTESPLSDLFPESAPSTVDSDLQFGAACGLVGRFPLDASTEYLTVLLEDTIRTRWEASVTRFLEIIPEFSEEVVHPSRHSLGTYLALTVVCEQTESPWEYPVISRAYDQLIEPDQYLLGPEIIPEGLTQLAESDAVSWDFRWESAFELWAHRIPAEEGSMTESRGVELQVFLRFARTLLSDGPVPDPGLLEATITRSAGSAIGWQRMEWFLAEYAPVAPEHALRLYQRALETHELEPYWSSYSDAESILGPGLTSETPEIVDLAREVTQVTAERTEEAQLLELLDETG